MSRNDDINQAELLPWTDVETFGLDASSDPIIEIGIKLTDLDLNVVAEKHWLLWSDYHDVRHKLLVENAKGDNNSKFVLDMHSRNGLFFEASNDGLPPSEVEEEVVNWLHENNAANLPMCGSSVDYDRKFIHANLPKVLQTYHYRVIDNSTIKELCRRFNPPVFARLPESKYNAPNWHRTRLCLEDTVDEFHYYRDEFLLW